MGQTPSGIVPAREYTLGTMGRSRTPPTGVDAGTFIYFQMPFIMFFVGAHRDAPGAEGALREAESLSARISWTRWHKARPYNNIS